MDYCLAVGISYLDAELEQKWSFGSLFPELRYNEDKYDGNSQSCYLIAQLLGTDIGGM